MSNYPDDILDSKDNPANPLYDGPEYYEDTNTYMIDDVEMTEDEYHDYKEKKSYELKRALAKRRRR